ncbi:hypothetical protein L6452_08302 [Arctium lappa]|uniref:Uncharacterized protein n=1 Tax=Arctium lappa TaxID=4217 RepID=A0ACB9DHC7_ARCLA|nr:hypothetical protein L6452_08302 [Arctium lappa]
MDDGAKRQAQSCVVVHGLDHHEATCFHHHSLLSSYSYPTQCFFKTDSLCHKQPQSPLGLSVFIPIYPLDRSHVDVNLDNIVWRFAPLILPIGGCQEAPPQHPLFILCIGPLIVVLVRAPHHFTCLWLFVLPYFNISSFHDMDQHGIIILLVASPQVHP